MQAEWRMHAAQRQFQKARQCIVRAQALRRGCIAQRRFLALRRAAITVQVCNEQAKLVKILNGLFSLSGTCATPQAYDSDAGSAAFLHCK